MNITEAIEHLINSEPFKEAARSKDTIGSRYRMFRYRYKAGELRNNGILTFLLEHGYEMIFTAPKETKVIEARKTINELKRRNFRTISTEKNGTIDWEQLEAFMKSETKKV